MNASLRSQRSSTREPVLRCLPITDDERREFVLFGDREKTLPRGNDKIFVVGKDVALNVGVQWVSVVQGKMEWVQLLDEAVITAWAPGYEPLKVACQPGRFTKANNGDLSADSWNYDSKGVLNLYLRKSEPQQPLMKQASLGRPINTASPRALFRRAEKTLRVIADGRLSRNNRSRQR